ncbi:MAG: hypothetical protein P8J91_10160 [Pirellulaceae bacterium]|nr:hypothetical protein [Pirellulaceae bacterium]
MARFRKAILPIVGLILVTVACGPEITLAQQQPTLNSHHAVPAKLLQLDKRRELFIDQYLIDQTRNTRLQLHAPQPAGVALKFDQPWEGAFSGYVTVIHDPDHDLYRMYYRGLALAGKDGTNDEVTCCAISVDGIHWKKPDLGIYEYQGTLANNIVMMNQQPLSHNFAPFLDKNPNTIPQQRFKALAGTHETGLVAFTSEDGFHWKRLQQEPVFRDGIFDSQNVAFWSPVERQYVCYFRTWSEGEFAGYRTVSRTTSVDFIHWTAPQPMSFGDTPDEHLYTNQTTPYFRAPHLSVGLAARFLPGRKVITEQDADNIGVEKRYFNDCSDIVLLSTRGGNQYDRPFMSSFVRPGLGAENWVSRSNYAARGIVPISPSEMAIYVCKNYGQPTSYVERYRLRTDGFASLHADYQSGEMITRPILIPEVTPDEIRQTKSAWLRRNIDLINSPKLNQVTPLWGEQSLTISKPVSIPLPETRNLGTEFTLAAHVQSVPAGHRRLFSAYGGGKVENSELVFDFDASKNIENDGAMRFILGDLFLAADHRLIGDWSVESGNQDRHHLAVTVGNGKARLFFDGKLLTEVPYVLKQPLVLKTSCLRFGEDSPPTSLFNEPFIGQVDDILVASTALSCEAVKELAERGIANGLSADAQAKIGLIFEPESGSSTNLPDITFSNRFGKPLTYTPDIDFGIRQLALNFSTSAAGSIYVEILDTNDQPIAGFGHADCDPIIGDQIDRIVTWQGRSDLQSLAGRAIRLRFHLKDADLFSLQFK